MNKKENLLIIVGPTAIGKSSVAIDVAKKLNGEIISADSMQIYKYMDIGTAKVKANETNGIPHYLIDVVNPDEEFTVADYKYHAKKRIDKINKSGKLPIVTGGTGLYINSLIYELKFTPVNKNKKFRQECELIANSHGNEVLYKKLSEVDPESYRKIHLNDRKRLIRALEIYHETGKPMSYYNKNFRKEVDKYNLIIFGLNTDRAQLYTRINKRVDKMIDEGLIEEVEALLKMGYSKDLTSMQAIGYKEIISYLENQNSFEESIETLKRNTRRFAKRQLTWFRRDKKIKWIDTNNFKNINEIGNYIADYCETLIG